MNINSAVILASKYYLYLRATKSHLLGQEKDVASIG